MNKTSMKSLQIIGFLIPFFLFGFAYYLFGDIEPNTPTYAGASLVMLLVGVSVLVVGFAFLFVLPSSVIFIKKENRDYFSFNSKIWLTVLFANVIFLLIYSAFFIAFSVTSVN